MACRRRSNKMQQEVLVEHLHANLLLARGVMQTALATTEQASPQPAPPQQAPSQQAPPQQAPPQQAPSQQASPQQAPSQQAPPQQAPPQPAPSQQAPPQQASPQPAPPQQAPSQQAPPQQAPPQQASPQPAPPQQAPSQQAPPQQAPPQQAPPQPAPPQQAPPQPAPPQQAPPQLDEYKPADAQELPLTKKNPKPRSQSLILNPFPCLFCEKRFPSRQILNIHELTHLTGLKCEVCQARFKSRAHLLKHRCCICKHCERIFESLTALQKHVKYISGFVCTHCNYRFKTALELNKHMHNYDTDQNKMSASIYSSRSFDSRQCSVLVKTNLQDSDIYCPDVSKEEELNEQNRPGDWLSFKTCDDWFRDKFSLAMPEQASPQQAPPQQAPPQQAQPQQAPPQPAPPQQAPPHPASPQQAPPQQAPPQPAPPQQAPPQQAPPQPAPPQQASPQEAPPQQAPPQPAPPQQASPQEAPPQQAPPQLDEHKPADAQEPPHTKNNLKPRSQSLILNPFPCPFCEKRFPSRQILNMHELTHLTGLKCEVCQASFKSRVHLLKHRCYICRHCERIFETLTSLQMHVKSISGFVCTHCNYRFKTALELNKHMHNYDTDQNKMSASRYSSRSFDSRQSSVLVKTNLQDSDIYTPDVSKEEELNEQIRPGDWLSCKICEEWFHDKFSLATHMRFHSPRLKSYTRRKQPKLTVESDTCTDSNNDEVTVKEEPGNSEEAAGLYAEHEIKDELVLGPVVLQPRDIAFCVQNAWNRNTDFKLEPGIASYTANRLVEPCSVKQEWKVP